MKKLIVLFIFLFFITILNAELNFDFAFSFSKINNEDELINLQLFDIDDDGIEEIITSYVNQNGLWRILGINKDGNIILNYSNEYNNNEFVPHNFHLTTYNNQRYLLISYAINNYPDLDTIKTKLYNFDNFTLVDTLMYEVENNTIYSQLQLCDISCCNANGILKIYVGYKNGILDYYLPMYQNHMIVLEYNGQEMSFIDEFNKCGEIIQSLANASIGHTEDSWDTGSSMGGEEHNYLKNLEGQQYYHSSTYWYYYVHGNQGYSSGEFKQFCLLTSNDISNQNHGSILYSIIYRGSGQYEHKTICFSYDLSDIIWEEWEMLIYPMVIQSSSNFTYNGENHYVIYSRNDTFTILDRLTGEVVDSFISNFDPFAMKQTINNTLLLFEDQDSIYNVYSDDPLYGISGEDFQDYVSAGNYPNPFHSSTTFSFTSKEPIQNDEIKIYNVRGQLVRVLHFDASSPSHFHEVSWDGKDKYGQKAAPGVYLYQLLIDGEQKAERKCLLIE